ncbi:MAG: hypothetical protein O7E56_04015, partial [SAR324 cluster bacterium]|nr:hypothetical protein [SAR324 cluster bacterium]
LTQPTGLALAAAFTEEDSIMGNTLQMEQFSFASSGTLDITLNNPANTSMVVNGQALLAVGGARFGGNYGVSYFRSREFKVWE